MGNSPGTEGSIEYLVNSEPLNLGSYLPDYNKSKRLNLKTSLCLTSYW